MKEQKNNILQRYDDIVDLLAIEFVHKYFGKDYLYDDDFYWVVEDREILAVGDYFFNLEDIVSFIRYKYTEKEMFNYYDYAMDAQAINEGKPRINIRNFKKIKKLK